MPLPSRFPLHRCSALALLGLCCHLPAFSTQPASPLSAPVEDAADWRDHSATRPVGEATRSLLQLQRSGQWASPHARPLPAAVAERIYERYLESFKHPLPEHFSPSIEGSARP